MGRFRTDILRDKLGVWVWDTDMQGIRETVERVHAHGFGWIAVKAQEGDAAYKSSSQQLDTWRVECEKHGLHFGVWGFLYGKYPVPEARTAAELVNMHGAQFYIADAESGYEAHPSSSEQFARSFQLLHPHLPKAVSSFGRIDFHRLDWDSWKRHGFTFMPQAYVDASPLLRPSTCINAARRVWNPSEMAVTLEASRHLTPEQYGEYVKEAARQGVRGFNIWRADLAGDELLSAVHRNR
jgi:hypothetical protein